MPEPAKVAYLVPSGPPIHELMRGAFPEGLRLVVPTSEGRAGVLETLSEADFAIAVRMDRDTIAAAPRLKLIQLAGVGFDGVDLEAATEAGIPVAQTVEGTIEGVAEHAVLLLLALYKRLLEADASVRRGEWLVWQLRPSSHTLQGKTVGLVGLGRIGQAVAERLGAFGVGLRYHDVRRADAETEAALGIRFMDLDELLRTSDVVTLHAPLTPETRGLIGAEALRAMKPTSVLINTARGGLVDEAALVEALRTGAIAGAGLDVFEKEPTDPDNPLFAFDNVVLTPHVATGTRDSVVEKARAAGENMLRVLRGERPHNVVNPAVFEGAEEVKC